MPSFAIAAEGITDQIIIERMIEQLCGDQDVDINFLQPSRDITDKHRAEHGGWELVFEYCHHRASDALATNDFLIVQIDTDCGEHQDYGLPLTVGGVARAQMALVDHASAIIAGHIGNPFFSDNRDRIIFAISVHSLESWLLLILYQDSVAVSGFNRLARKLQRENNIALTKSADVYRTLARRVKRRRLLELAHKPHSLGAFLTRLLAACNGPSSPPTRPEEGAGAEV